MADFKYEIIEKFGTFSNNNGWTKEVNLIKYGNGYPKLDIRSWTKDESGNLKMSKGITLTKEEAKELISLLNVIDIDTLEF